MSMFNNVNLLNIEIMLEMENNSNFWEVISLPFSIVEVC